MILYHVPKQEVLKIKNMELNRPSGNFVQSRLKITFTILEFTKLK